MGPWPTGPRLFPKSSCAVTVPPPPPPRHTAFTPRLASPSLRSLDGAEVAQLTWCGWLVTCPPCLELSSTFGVGKGTPHAWGQVQANPRGGRRSRERGPAQCPCGCPPGQRWGLAREHRPSCALATGWQSPGHWSRFMPSPRSGSPRTQPSASSRCPRPALQPRLRSSWAVRFGPGRPLWRRSGGPAPGSAPET